MVVSFVVVVVEVAVDSGFRSAVWDTHGSKLSDIPIYDSVFYKKLTMFTRLCLLD